MSYRTTGSLYPLCLALLLGAAWTAQSASAGRLGRPNIVVILADDLGFSDLGCYGSSIRTPNLDRLATGGLRFTQFYNMARCCPTRASLLTGLYNHQVGVGHMTGDWSRYGAAYGPGLNQHCATTAELLREAGYGTYLSGKWHVGGFGKGREANHPLKRGFDRFYGTNGGGDYFKPSPLRLDDQPVYPDKDYYFTDAVTDHAVRFVEDHSRARANQPFFLHLCYTAPHFPLQARPEDIERYRGKFAHGWDEERARRFARQQQMGLMPADARLSPRDPVAQPWSEASDKTEWDLRMAVYAAMIDRMDQGVGRVMDTIRRLGVEENTLVMFLSDNGSSAEFLDSWPDAARGHQPGTPTGAPGSHKCLEIGWANAANTPFRECKMWDHEGGIASPLIVNWPRRIPHPAIVHEVASVLDLMPTLLDVGGAPYPTQFQGREMLPLEGISLLRAFKGGSTGRRTLFWEHEGNRAVRQGNWKLVAQWKRPWELYDLAADRTETRDLAKDAPARVAELAALWQIWANRVGVVPWEQLPGSLYKPTPGYRRKSEPVASDWGLWDFSRWRRFAHTGWRPEGGWGYSRPASVRGSWRRPRAACPSSSGSTLLAAENAPSAP